MAEGRGWGWLVGVGVVGWACAGGALEVREAFDVPPPPGARTLELGPDGRFAGIEPGEVVTVGGQDLEVIDQQRAVVTVYVDERVAEGWLAEGSVETGGGCAL